MDTTIVHWQLGFDKPLSRENVQETSRVGLAIILEYQPIFAYNDITKEGCGAG